MKPGGGIWRGGISDHSFAPAPPFASFFGVRSGSFKVGFFALFVALPINVLRVHVSAAGLPLLRIPLRCRRLSARPTTKPIHHLGTISIADQSARANSSSPTPGIALKRAFSGL